MPDLKSWVYWVQEGRTDTHSWSSAKKKTAEFSAPTRPKIPMEGVISAGLNLLVTWIHVCHHTAGYYAFIITENSNTFLLIWLLLCCVIVSQVKQAQLAESVETKVCNFRLSILACLSLLEERALRRRRGENSEIRPSFCVRVASSSV